MNGSDAPVTESPKSPLQQRVDKCFEGKPYRYHLTEDEEEGKRQLHIGLNKGLAMIIDLNQGGDIEARIQHDMTYLPRLAELARLFPYRLTGPRHKVEWITANKN